MSFLVSYRFITLMFGEICTVYDCVLYLYSEDEEIKNCITTDMTGLKRHFKIKRGKEYIHLNKSALFFWGGGTPKESMNLSH